MLHQPDIVRILSIDPGLAFCGWSFIEYDLETDQKTIVRYGSFQGKTLLKNQKPLQAVFERRPIILWELENEFIDLINDLQPDYIVAESPFAHRFVQAYAALTLAVQAIRTAAYKTICRDIYLVAPREGKKAVSNEGGADKALVQSAIRSNASITIRPKAQMDLDSISEHEYDAMAVGVAFIQNQLPSILASKNMM